MWESCRSRARSPGRSPRLTTCSTPRRSRSSARRRCRSGTASSASSAPRSARRRPCGRIRWHSTSAASCCATGTCAASPRRRRPTLRATWRRAAIRRNSRSRAQRQRLSTTCRSSTTTSPTILARSRASSLAPYTQVAGGEGWRTALSFVTDHRPGSLHRALGPLARNGVNLVQLVSRPLPNSPWRYRFDVVLDGHVFDPSVRPALHELRAVTRELRLFGSYAAERTQ